MSKSKIPEMDKQMAVITIPFTKINGGKLLSAAEESVPIITVVVSSRERKYEGNRSISSTLLNHLADNTDAEISYKTRYTFKGRKSIYGIADAHTEPRPNGVTPKVIRITVRGVDYEDLDSKVDALYDKLLADKIELYQDLDHCNLEISSTYDEED